MIQLNALELRFVHVHSFFQKMIAYPGHGPQNIHNTFCVMTDTYILPIIIWYSYYFSNIQHYVLYNINSLKIMTPRIM